MLVVVALVIVVVDVKLCNGIFLESKTSISKAVEEFNREKKEFLQKKKQIPKKGIITQFL